MMSESRKPVPGAAVAPDSLESHIAIVGTGHAGISALRELRSLGHRGPITFMGQERHLPYERPPLSKDVLRGHGRVAPPLLLREEELAALNVDFRRGFNVVALDAPQRRVFDASGAHVAFDSCLLATGGTARELPSLPTGTPGVHYVRSLDDAIQLGEALVTARSALVIGAGFLGLEVASSAIALCPKVTVLDTADRLLPRVIPQQISMWLESRCTRAGLEMLLGCGIVSMHADGRGHTVRLNDGRQLSADLIIVAIGQQPNVALAHIAGLQLDPVYGGLAVDEQCRTSLPGVYAAGDCTSQHHPWYGGNIRLESWQSAIEQGRIAAAAMLGQATTPRAVPWFWTDVLDCNIQVSGSVPKDAAPTYLLRGALDDSPRPKALLLGVQNSRLVHAVAVNAGGDLRALRPLLESVAPLDVGQLADESVPLRQVVKSLITPLQGVAT